MSRSPDGSKSDNTVYNATPTSIINKFIQKEKARYEINIANVLYGREVVYTIPRELELLISEVVEVNETSFNMLKFVENLSGM